jgi:poly-gamma-glutamate capsule biosynthesis protein CapA/YwtB (metallophosphatase superfamily)
VVKLALAGDTMLGRRVAERLARVEPESLVSDEVVEAVREADFFVLNLECCISERGERWPAPGKPFFFRAPPAATRLLAHLGVTCVTLGNNHALDFGADALRDTFDHLAAADIAWVGAGQDLHRAREPIVLTAAGFRLAVIGFTDHPDDFAAARDRPGVAFAALDRGLPDWVRASIAHGLTQADAVLVTPHWGPNMTAAGVLVDAGATLVAGHSAHVFHGIAGRVLYDLGDFLDDYAVDRALRNDLGLLWLVTLDADALVRIEAIPLKLDFCHTRLADGRDAHWIARRFRQACAAFGTHVSEEGGRLIIRYDGPVPAA